MLFFPLSESDKAPHYIVREGGRRKLWSGWDGSYVGWLKEVVSSVLDAEGVASL